MPVLKGALVAMGLVAVGWMLVLMWEPVPRLWRCAVRRMACWRVRMWRWLVELWMRRVPIQMRGLLLAMVLSGLCGAAVMWRMGNRFEIVRQTGGLVLRLDRWTGKTWMMDPQWKRWVEVRE